MLKMKNYLKFFLIVSTFYSCSKYQKVLRSTDYDYKFEKAVSYYNDGDFNRAMPIFNELSTVLKGTSKIHEVSYYYAYCY